MTNRMRPAAALTLAALLTPLASGPVSAHALHGDIDAPLPLVAYLLGAAIAVALSFAFAAISDAVPPGSPEVGTVRALPRIVRLGLRILGLLAWAWVVAQAIAGGSSDAEVASVLLWVFGWVGLALVSALVFPVWRWLDPFTTLYDLLAAVARRVGMDAGKTARRPGMGAWPAVVLMGGFVWLELVLRLEDGRGLGLVLVGYTLVSIAGMVRYGSAIWSRSGEVFGVWFGLLGRLAPYGAAGPPSSGRVRRRSFGSALAVSPWSAAMLVMVAMGAGAVIWDGISQTQPYLDLVGTPGVPGETVLLVLFLGLLAGLVLGVGRRVGYPAMGAGLVPVTVGYVVAHYLTYLLIEGQRVVVAFSDPFQQGWDLLGTASWEPRSEWLPASLVWTLQVTAVVLGHVVGAWLGHGAVRGERADGRAVSQWPLAALMVGLTVVALWSLGQNLVFVTSPAVAGVPAATAPIPAVLAGLGP